MRRLLIGLTLIILSLFTHENIQAQNCLNTGLNGTTISLPCNVNCTQLKMKVPHLKSTSDYTLVDIPYTPYPYTTSTGTELTALYVDDVFSSSIPLPFSFCFWDSTYTKAIVGSNGIITFDELHGTGTCGNSYNIATPIPGAGPGVPCSGNSDYNPRASIMAMYEDLLPTTSGSPAGRKIEWRLEGSAPCRRLIVSYNKIGVFGNGPCSLATPNTFQIVIYESTGIIEIYVEQKACYPTLNGGNAIMGIQNWARNKAVFPPGKNVAQWSENNKAYQFVPSGNTSRFVKAELYDMSGTLLQTTTPADTTTTVPGLLDVKFPSNICPSANSVQYVVKTYFSSCSDVGTQIISSDTVNVVKTTSLTATATATPAACGPNGSISINIPPGAGTLPYTLTIDGGAPITINTQTHTFTGLIGGSHTIVISTAGGCLQTLTVNVPVSGVLTVIPSITPTSCNGAANGSVTLNPQNGVAPFLYALNGGPIQTNNTFSGLPPGTYLIKVADASGCVLNNFPVTIPSGTTINAQITTLAPACAGVANGSITINPNGTPPYQYNINNGPFQSSNTFPNLASGNYVVSVKDAVNCTSGNISITVPPSTGSLQVQLTPTATSCTGVNNGTIAITPQSGSGPFEYSINNGTTWTTGTQISSLAPNTYNVIVRDASGCSSTPQAVTINAGSALQATTPFLPTSCSGASDGTITVNPTNGAAPYQYKIDGGAYQGIATFSGLTAGNHTIILSDASGCTSNPITVTIPAGASITASAVSTPTSCSGASNGTITVTPTNPVGTYQYSLDGTTFQSSATFTGLAANTYTITFRNNLGCSGTLPSTVTAGPPVTANVAVVNVACNGGNTGTATATLSSNATAPAQYSLDGITYQSSNVFAGLTAGNYTLYFKEVNNCAGTQTFTVTEPTPISGSVTAQPVICNGQSNGVLTVSASGGTPAYQYSVDGTTYQSSNTFNLPAGNYTVTIRDANNCTKALAPITLTEPQALSATGITTNASCNGGADGTITVTATGGTAPYQYALNSGTYQPSNVFNVIGGTYSVTVRDANSCTYVLTNQVVGLNNNLVVTPASDERICESKSAILQASTNATQFAWQPSTGLSSTSVKNPTASPVTTTTYYLTATLGNCVAYDTIVVNVDPAPIPSAGTGSTICFGQTYQLQGTGGITYEWSPAADVVSGAGTSSPTVKPNQTTQYSLHVVDGNGCHSLQPSTATVNVTPPFSVFTNPTDTVAFIGDTLHLNANSIGTTYQWSPSIGLSDPDIKNPVLVVTANQVYTVVATTAAGCQGTTTFKIQAFVGPEIYVPNAFTPNGDGVNDLLRPFPVGIQTLRFFKVFNRWGQEVYSWKGNARGPEVYNLQARTDIGWNGRIDGGLQPTQTYVWVAEGVTKEGKVIQRKGTTVLIR